MRLTKNRHHKLPACGDSAGNASTEQDNAALLKFATADLAATVDRAQTLLGTTDDLGNPVPIDWSTISTLPGGATGLPVNFTPVDPNAPPPADTLTGGSAAEPIVPFLLPLLLPLAPQSRLAPDTPDPDRRELPDDHREAANGISRPRGQLAPTHGQTGNWSDLYKFAHNTPAASDNPPPHPKQTVTNVPRQEQENGTRLRINPDETLAGGDGRTMADIMRQRMVTPPKPQASYLQRLQDSYVNAVRRIAELVKLLDQDRDKEGQPVADNVQDHREQELERWEAEAERLRVLLVRAGYQFENQSRAFSSEFEFTGVNDLIKNDQTDRAAVQKPFSQGLIKAGNEFLEYSKDYATERATDQVVGSVGGIAAAKLLSAAVGKAHDFYKAYKAQKALRQPKSVGAMARRGHHKIEPQPSVPKKLTEGFDFGKHLRGLIGDPPNGMVDPHAHHILFKKGLGPAQQTLVDEGQSILRKVGIDPIYGKENLIWAPWRISKQHGMESLKDVVDKLRELDRIGADYDDFVEALRILGQKAGRTRHRL